MDRDLDFATFGAWVRARRRQLDLTQAELGKRVTCSEATIRKIEADERKPSRELADLLARVLAIPESETPRFLQFARGVWVSEPGFTVIKTDTTLTNLPALMTSTIDRIKDHAAVSALLRDPDVRLVTVIGPPGIGKTRLSLHCGNTLITDFRDGVRFVDLAEVSNPAFFIHAVARALPGFDLPPSPDLDQMARSLKNRQLLLILDNFEQIAEGAALDLAQLLKGCAGVKALVTSRLTLRIYGEYEYPLPPLTVPPPDSPTEPDTLMQYESVQLLVARIRQHQPGFRIDANNAAAMKQICLTMDGIPLALELAAASLRQLSFDQLVNLRRGRDWIAQIGTPARDLPQRQRTLENVIEWSYGLLYDQERNFYARLGVLAGWFDAAAAAALNETDEGQAFKMLAALTDHSLLLKERTNQEVRWRMLEIIRAHAYSKLSAPDEIELRRASFFLDQIRLIQHTSQRPAQEDFFNRHRSNLHGSLVWAIGEGRTDLAFALASQLERYWEPLGFLKEGLDFCRQLLMSGNSLESRQKAFLTQAAADLAWQQHDFEKALLYSRQSVELGLTHEMKGEYPWYLVRLGRIFIEQGKLSEARVPLNEALTLSSDSEALLNPGVPLVHLGEIDLLEGNVEAARALIHQALFYLGRKEDIFYAMATTDLAEVALASGDFGEAHEYLLKALTPARGHIRRSIIFLLAMAGYLILSPGGSAEEAARFLGAVDALSERSGVPLGSFYLASIRKRIELIRKKISEHQWQAASKEGKSWSKEKVFQQALSVLAAAGESLR